MKPVIAAEFPGLRAGWHSILADGTGILGINGDNRTAGRELLRSGSLNWWRFHDVLGRSMHILIKDTPEKAINEAGLIQRVVEFYNGRPIYRGRPCHVRSARRGHYWIRGRGE